jgi:hypothetical protein
MEEALKIAEKDEEAEVLKKLGEEEKIKEEERKREREKTRLKIITKQELEKQLTEEIVCKLQMSSIPREQVNSVCLFNSF